MLLYKSLDIEISSALALFCFLFFLQNNLLQEVLFRRFLLFSVAV